MDLSRHRCKQCGAHGVPDVEWRFQFILEFADISGILRICVFDKAAVNTAILRFVPKLFKTEMFLILLRLDHSYYCHLFESQSGNDDDDGCVYWKISRITQ